jgi:predicted transcriptional regulator
MTLEAKVDHEQKIVEMIRAGQADIDAGRVVSHEEVMAEMDAIIATAIVKSDKT